MTTRPTNRELLVLAARRLEDLCQRVTFVGGAVVELLVTDPAAAPPRPTRDIDVVIDVPSRADYLTRLRDRLLALGFSEDTEEGAPICRWVAGELKVDIMPCDSAVLGFGGRWHQAAHAEAAPHEIAPGLVIRLVGAPEFLAMKLAAFRDRGRGDHLAGHDLEDVMTVVDGRP